MFFVSSLMAPETKTLQTIPFCIEFSRLFMPDVEYFIVERNDAPWKESFLDFSRVSGELFKDLIFNKYIS